MDRDDNRSSDWLRTRPLRVRVCDIDEPLRECSHGDEGVSPGLAKPLVQTDSRCHLTLPPLLHAEAARFSLTVFEVGQQSRDYLRSY
jgi:hypothetical protein